MRRVYLIVGFVSVAIIAYQLTLMRILSIIQFHHFAYMIISVALLGFGASGTFLTVFRQRSLKYFEDVIFYFSLTFSFLIFFSAILIQFISFDPFLILWEISEVWSLLFFYLIIFLPFFFGAAIICLSFLKYAAQINRLYFFNLTGSAIGGISILLLMFAFNPFTLPFLVWLISFLAVIVSLSSLKRKTVGYILTLACASCILFYQIIFPHEIKMSEYKSLYKTTKLPDAKIIDDKSSPLGWLITISTPVLRYAPGLSYNFKGEIPTQIGLFSDGEWAGAILWEDSSSSKTKFLDYSTSVLPYRLLNSNSSKKKNNSVLVIGAGTGTEIQTANQNGAENILGIELNPQVVEISKKYSNIIRQALLADSNSRTKIIMAEGRGFLQEKKEKFDIITIPIFGGFTASAAGTHSLYENYLFTVESFSLIIDRLKNDGIFAVSTWLNYPPRHAIKLFATILESAEKAGINLPANNLAAIRSWGTAIILVKKTPFTKSEIELIKNFCEENSFDPIYYPGILSGETNKYNQLEDDVFLKAVNELISDKRESFYKNYLFDIEPPTDDKPYFSHFLKLKSLPYLLDKLGKENVAFFEWGYLILIITLCQIVILSFALIIIPLLFLKKFAVKKAVKFKTFLYFSGLGIGFMFIEIVMIQKFILFLSHPIYSVSLVISSILFFAGVGSYFSSKFLESPKQRLRIIVGAIIMAAFIYSFFLPHIFQSLIHLSITVKYVLSFFIIAPLAFLMGMPFPIGLKQLSYELESLIPWAWGINGFLSVISAVLAPLLAIEFGFKIVIIFAGIAYLLVLSVGGNLKEKRKEGYHYE